MCVVKIFQPKDYKGVNLVNEKVLTKEITRLQTELTNKIDDVNTTLDTKIDETKEELESNLNSAKEELGQKIDETEQKLDSKIDTTKQGLEEKINTEKEALEDKIEQTQQKLEGDLETAKGELNSTIKSTAETLRGELQATDTKLDNKINTTKTELEGQIEQAKTELTGNLESTEAEIKEEIKTTKEGLEGKITEAENTLNSTINSTKSDLENKIDETKSTLDSNLSTAKTELEGKITQAQQELQDSIDTKADDSKVTELGQRVDQLDQDKADVTALNEAKQELQTSIDGNAKKIEAANELIESTTDRIDEELGKLDGKITANTGSITTLQAQANATDENLTSLSSKVDGLESGKVDSATYETKIQELEEEIEDRVTTENFNKKLEEYTNTEELNQLLEAKADDTDITELESKITEATDKASSDLDTHAKDTTLHPTQEKQQEWDTKVDAATLETAKQEITNAYKEAISTAVGTVFNWKGSVQTKDELGDKEAEAKVGDVWNVRDTGANYVWSGPKGDISGGWDKLSENLEGFATKDNLDGHIRDTNVHFDGDEKASFKSSLQSNTSSIASLNSAMLDHNSKIELLQKEDKSINAKLETKADQTDLDALDDKVDDDIAALNAHTTNTDIHFTDGNEKTKWRGDINANTSELSGLRGEFEEHTENSDIHFRDSEKNTWRNEIDQAKSDISALQSNTQGTATELSELQSKVEQNETTLTTHIADTTNAHFEEGEKARLKKEVEDNKAAIATKAEESKVTTLEEKVDQFIESVGKEWDSETSSTSESPQSGKAVKGAIDEALKSYTSTEGLTELLKEKADKNTVTELQSIVEGHTASITEIQDSLNDKVDDAKLTEQLQAYTLLTTFNEHTTDTDLHVDAAKQSKWNAKVDTELLDSTVNTAKIELEAKINEVEKKIPEVDKTYDAESFESSTNAQSGVSVKGALDTLHSQITSETESTLTNYITTTDLNKKLEDKADKTTLETHINNTDVHFKENEKSQWETKINTTAENLETVTTQVTSNSNNIELLQTKDTVHDAAIQSNTTNITKLQNTVSALESQVETLETEVVTVENTYKPQSEDAISGKGVADALSGYTNTTDLTGLLNDKATKTELSQVEDKLGQYLTIEDAVAGYAAKTEVATLTEEVNKKAMQESVTALQQRVEEMVTQEAFETALEDYTTTEELNTQINGLEASITAAQSTATKAQSNLETHIVDETKHPSIQKQQEWSTKVDSVTLESTKEQITQAYQDAINKAVGSVFKWKGTISTLEELKAISAPNVGDVYNVTDEGGANYVYSGEDPTGDNKGWDKLSENLEGFATNDALTSHINNSSVHFTNEQKSQWDTMLQGHTTSITSLFEKVTGHDTSIEELQNADKTINATLETKANTSDLVKKADASVVTALQKTIDNKANTVDLNEHKEDDTVHFTSPDEKSIWKNKINTTESNLTEVTSQVADHGQKIEQLQDKDTELEGSIQKQGTQFTALQSSVNTNTNNITSLQSDVNTLKGQVVTVDKEYNAESFNESTNAQSGVSVHGAIDTALGSYATIQYVDTKTEGLATEGNITLLTQKVDKATGDLTTHTNNTDIHFKNKEEKDGWNTKITANETAISTLQTTVSEKADTETVNTLSDKVEQTLTKEEASSTYAKQTEVQSLQSELGKKASQDEVDGLTELVNEKADKESLTTELAKYTLTTELNKQLADKADKSQIITLQSSIDEKIDNAELEEVLTEYVKNVDLTDQLQSKADKSEVTTQIEAIEKKIPKVSDTYNWQSTDAQSGKALYGALEIFRQTIDGDIDETLVDYVTNEDLQGEVSTLTTNISTAQTTADNVKSSLETHIQDSDKHPTEEQKTKWDNKAEKQEIEDAKSEITTAYQTAINKAVGSVFKWKGTVQSKSNLQEKESTAQIGDVWNVTDEGGANYVWSGSVEEEGSGWDKLSENLEGFAIDADLTAHTSNSNFHFTAEQKSQWQTDISEAKTNITSLTSQVEGLSTNLESTTLQASSNAAQIELLQKADQDINNKLSSKVDSTEFEELETTVTQLDDKFGQYLTKEEATTEYAKVTVTNKLAQDLETKADDSELQALTELVSEKVDQAGLESALEDYVTQVSFDGHVNGDGLHTSTQEKAAWNAKIDQDTLTSAISSAKNEIETEIESVRSSIPTVSDHYDGFSEDAQSGKAVFEALGSSQEAVMYQVQEKLNEYTPTEELDPKFETLTTNVSTAQSAAEAAQSTADAVQISLNAHTSDENKHVSTTDRSSWDAKVDTAGLTTAISEAKETIKTEYQKAISDAVGSMFTWKGTVENKAALANKEDGAKIGDVWNVKDTGANYVWKGKDSGSDEGEDPVGWDKLSESLEGLATTANLDEHKNNTNIHFTNQQEKTDWNTKITEAASTITTLTSQVQHNSGSIEQLQVKDQELEKKIDDKLQDALTSTSITKVLVYTDASKAPQLSERQAGVLYLIAEASS